MKPKKVMIMGAAGRDFHNFNAFFRDNPNYRVVAFTATQIPDIEGRVYPAELAGKLYPEGIPIHPEEKLIELIKKEDVDEVVFAYSDVSHNYVMSKASEVAAAGADFRLMGPKTTMLKSSKPVIAVTAVRTGAGKSHTAQKVCRIIKDMGKKVVAIRHPMPYGDLKEQVCQRFASYEDMDRHKCTIEEREEYEPHIDAGTVVYAGVDYAVILREAEKEADVIVWDGGNNDFSFIQADLYIVLADALRPGHEISYHPGETNLRLADVVVINNVDAAGPEDVALVRNNILKVNPGAAIIEAASPVSLAQPDAVRGRKVLVVEDGPTATHGEMEFVYGYIAAKKFGAAAMVDPRPFAVGTIKDTYEQYPHIGALLPAMGYSPQQVRDLEATINASDADVVVAGTPIDLSRIIKVNKPIVRISYELQEIGQPTLDQLLQKVL